MENNLQHVVNIGQDWHRNNSRKAMDQRKVIITTLIITLIAATRSFAQPSPIDSSYINVFQKNNVVELYPSIYSTHFNFTNPKKNSKDNYRLLVNSSGYVGFYIGYKWLSLKYSW